jgi:hypothetical protein
MKRIIPLLFFVCSIVAGPPLDSKHRPSSYPYISGDTFRSFCNHICDETNARFNPGAVRRGDTIFVNGDILEHFFNTYHHSIPHPYILVVHNTDCRIPGDNCARYLDDPKLIMLFTQNMDRNHVKLKGLPIGLANYHWSHGKTEVVGNIRSRGTDLHREVINKVYLNFEPNTNPSIRPPIWNYFVTKPFCLIGERKPHDQYLEDMRRHRFVISPPGNGVDCHRHWEALYMGCIPIMKSTSIDVLFQDLPVIIVADWDLVTEELLEKELSIIMSQSFKYEKLYAQYWFDIIRSYQENSAR